VNVGSVVVVHCLRCQYQGILLETISPVSTSNLTHYHRFCQTPSLQ
jgi:hypothetical protein